MIEKSLLDRLKQVYIKNDDDSAPKIYAVIATALAANGVFIQPIAVESALGCIDDKISTNDLARVCGEVFNLNLTKISKVEMSLDQRFYLCKFKDCWRTACAERDLIYVNNHVGDGVGIGVHHEWVNSSIVDHILEVEWADI